VLVASLDFGADGKVAKKIQDKFRSIIPEGSLFLASPDEEEDRYAKMVTFFDVFSITINILGYLFSSIACLLGLVYSLLCPLLIWRKA